MSILIRKVGRRAYAYRVDREGGRVRHRYLGRADDPGVSEKIRRLRAVKTVPGQLRRLFWDTSLDNIDLRRHKKYVIARILDIGRLTDVQWLQMVYPTRVIQEVNETSRQISEVSRNFWRRWFECPLFD
ncbi:MAG: hypothetical protein A3G34_03530 [Candidatus Lindowbacteria bacterium RIFCSPLOWO2_12_FULL_62_27]|nr:MAG: hypothetical protein A3G34_03530 [Candidatus Lindowbacteria bacterium RIFCSPLOWO2_12_FULL_62_27]OGH63743.1 MAG: hypothetical protein A3I06_06545 [Candidatus Lindowbacteria bacterium RIFCSPLOWO2_02_FULL_62_12]